MDDTSGIVLLILWFASVVLAGFKVLGISRAVRSAVVVEEDKVRDMTPEERVALARLMAHEKGRWFWHLILIGLVVVAMVYLFLRLGLLP